MANDNQTELRAALSEDLMEVLVKVAILIVLAVLCFRIFSPFIGVLLWGLILAVALYPLQRRLAGRMGGRQGGAATVIVVTGMVLIGGPVIMLGAMFAGFIQETYQAVSSNTLTISPPDPSVAGWPLIGEKLHAAWTEAANDLPAFLEQMQPQLGRLSSKLLATAASTMGAVLVFLGALIIAGIMMAFGESGSAAVQRIMSRLAGAANGPRLHKLTTATIRSVATGVVGVAFIQALLLGVGFAFAGIPMAGVLALIVLLIGILQLPALLISLPAIGYLWWAGDGGTVNQIIWTVYLLLAGAADNVLKPMLLGRGVDVPMPVVLIGALGGMVSAGIVGLFIGAVILAVGYQLFMDWVERADTGRATASAGGGTAPAEAAD
ncbi:MAG: AI-2E family transporter [Pseudomonadales bacterium]|jgi:predicted PurR-regulated permease PerM